MIHEFQDPIWERQKGETPTQYCYFLEYLQFPNFNLKQFREYICDNYEELDIAGAKPPTYNTLKNWSAENKWSDRKTEKRRADKQDILETLHELDKQEKIKNFETKRKIKEKLLARISRDIDLDLPFSQINQGVQAYNTLHEDDLLDQEEPTTYTKSDISAETEINNSALDTLAKAYEKGKEQYAQSKKQGK